MKLLIRLNGRPIRFRPDWGRPPLSGRRRAAALRRRALHQVRTATAHSAGERHGRRGEHRVSRAPPLHTTAHHRRRRRSPLARCCGCCRLSRHSLSGAPAITAAGHPCSLAPRKAAAVWTPAVRDRRHAVSWPLSMTSEPGRSGSCLECRRARITDSTRPDAQASWPCLA